LDGGQRIISPRSKPGNETYGQEDIRRVGSDSGLDAGGFGAGGDGGEGAVEEVYTVCGNEKASRGFLAGLFLFDVL
jgi:hypothetical protein